MRRLFDGRLSAFIKDPNKKGVIKMLKEMTILFFKKKELPLYYVQFAYKKKNKNYQDFLSTGEKIRIGKSDLIHNSQFKTLINNKLFFALFCEGTSIKTPKLIGYNLTNNFFFNKKVTTIHSKDELVVFFKKVFDESNINEIFFRPPEEDGGKGCFKVTQSNLNYKLTSVYSMLTTGVFVHTEVLKQHEEINKIHSASINTLRIITFITLEGTIEVIAAFIRFGVGNIAVDNISKGGIFVGIDLETGILNDIGYVGPGEGDVETDRHTDSGYKFAGFKIPYFTEACELVKEAIEVIPERFIGWDVAITPYGPVIVESNSTPGLTVSDISYGGILQNKHARALVEEINTNLNK